MLSSDRSKVSKLKVSAEQLAYVDPINDTLAHETSARDNFVMEADGAIVGFFQIDARSKHRIMPDLLVLHEVQIDARAQGKRYGRQFMGALSSCLRHEYPWADGVCLTVNCKNLHAYRLYAAGGFVDTGNLYHGGRSGPQHIMVCRFAAA